MCFRIDLGLKEDFGMIIMWEREKREKKSEGGKSLTDLLFWKFG